MGINNRQSYSSPKQIPGTTWVAADTAGPNLNCLALKKDGTLWTWGSGSEGMTGQNQSAPTGGTRSSPVQIPGKWTTSMSGTLAQAQDGEQPFQINQNGSFLQALLYDLGG